MIRAASLAALALALAIPVAAQNAPSWRPVDAETGKIRDVEGLEALAEAFPDSGSVRVRLLQVQLGEGDHEAALTSLAWLKERGYVFSEDAQAQIPQLVGEEHADAAKSLLIPRSEIIEASEVIAEVPAEAGLIESVLAVPNEEVLVATSVTGRSLHVFLPKNGWIAAPMPGASDLSGIVTEPGSNIGWVASANLDGSEDQEELMTGLLGIRGGLSPETFALAPEGVAISDLSIGPDGTVYASDPMGGGIYHKAPGLDASLDELVAPGTFRSPQGSVVSDDGKKLYVSDYRYGLAMIDLASGEATRLSSEVPVILDGTDGLWLHDGELIAIQNGTSPMRISAFTLSDNGTRIIAARVLEQAHSGWTEPLGGSIANDALVYVATGQWDRYEKGQLREGMEAIPTDIRRLPLK